MTLPHTKLALGSCEDSHFKVVLVPLEELEWFEEIAVRFISFLLHEVHNLIAILKLLFNG